MSSGAVLGRDESPDFFDIQYFQNSYGVVDMFIGYANTQIQIKLAANLLLNIDIILIESK